MAAHERWSLNAWKDMFKEIYENQNLALTPDQVLHRLIEETAELVRPIFMMDMKHLGSHLSDVFAWVCAYANKTGIDLDKLMTQKYVKEPPGKVQRSMSTFALIGKDHPENLSDWQEFLGLLYREENVNTPPTVMLSRLMQDVGEASRRIRKRRSFGEISDRVGGVLGWTIALANKFNLQLGSAVWSKYPNMCWHCRHSPCTCFKLTTLFLSYTTDTREEMFSIKELAEKLKFKVKMFEELGQAFPKGRMVKAFNAVNESDGAILILAKQWSVNVYAELIEILRTMNEKNVWIYVKDIPEEKREQRLSHMLEDVKHFHWIELFSSRDELLKKAQDNLIKRLKELKKLEETSGASFD